MFGESAEDSDPPGPVPPSPMPRWLQRDRDYQEAAKAFYQQKFELAVSRFSAISKDTRSPWHKLARLLVARTMIRAAFSGADQSYLPDPVKVAPILKGILADESMAEWHGAAWALLTYIGEGPPLEELLLRSDTGSGLSEAIAQLELAYEGQRREPASFSTGSRPCGPAPTRRTPTASPIRMRRRSPAGKRVAT